MLLGEAWEAGFTAPTNTVNHSIQINQLQGSGFLSQSFSVGKVSGASIWRTGVLKEESLADQLATVREHKYITAFPATVGIAQRKAGERK